MLLDPAVILPLSSAFRESGKRGLLKFMQGSVLRLKHIQDCKANITSIRVTNIYWSQVRRFCGIFQCCFSIIFSI